MVVKHCQLLAVSMAAFLSTAAPAQHVITANELRAFPKSSEVDPQFQSFNVEVVAVTGDRFWTSYYDPTGARYGQRPPIDLTNKRLNILAAGLASAHMRVSGTWPNSTYIPPRVELRLLRRPAIFSNCSPTHHGVTR